jgi:hypothetical protein
VRTKIIVPVVASLVIGFALVFYSSARSENPAVAIGLKYSGITSDNYAAFMVWVTNTSPAASLPGRLQFQWVGKSGRTDTCHADLERHGQDVASAFIGVPAGAKKLRVLLCGSPGAMRKKVSSLVKRLPLPLQRIFPDSWLNQSDVHSPFPWHANPAFAGNVANTPAFRLIRDGA